MRLPLPARAGPQFGWYSAGLKQCFTFNFSGVALPSNIVYGIAFNTTDYGATPTGVPGPYDSLNVAVSTDGTSDTENNVTAGSSIP